MTAVQKIIPERFAAAAQRVMVRCGELARITESPGRIHRIYLSPEHSRANRLVAEWMRELGMRTWQDAAGNQLGRLEPAVPTHLGTHVHRNKDARALLLGSHLDTVVDAGRFDGVLGVLMALEVVRLLRETREEGYDTVFVSPFHFALEVAAFSDEEGTRFGKALLGSSAVGGLWDDAWWALTEPSGVSLSEAFREFGLDPGRIRDATRRPDELVGYLEAHIEQGPELDRRGEPLAVVSSIAAARRFQLIIEGEARHAGGTPYDMRRDALLGASEAALAVERLCRTEHHITGTVGQFSVLPGAINVIPGMVRFSVDLRGEFADQRDRVWGDIANEIDSVTRRRGLRWEAAEVHNAAATVCAPGLQHVIHEGIRAAVPHGTANPATLFSPAGHDAMAIAAVTEVGMLFLRNPDGISHHPNESVSVEDVALGLRAYTEAVTHIGHHTAQ